MNQIVENIMALAKEYRDAIDDHGPKRQALRAAIEQALKAGEPVAEFRGRRQTPEGTTEFWGVMLCDPMQDPPKGAKLYLGPVNDPVPADWRSVIPGGRYTDKWESARVGDFNEGWNTYRKAVITALSAAAPHPQPKPLFGDLIAQHPGLSEELAEMQAPKQEPVACKTLCDLCVKRGYESCANVAKITAIPAAPQPQPKQEPVAWTTQMEIDWAKQNPGRAGYFWLVPNDNPQDVPLYTAPQPQREWVGLTPDERDALVHRADALLDHIYEYGTASEGIRPRLKSLFTAVEANLREKNT